MPDGQPSVFDQLPQSPQFVQNLLDIGFNWQTYKSQLGGAPSQDVYNVNQYISNFESRISYLENYLNSLSSGMNNVASDVGSLESRVYNVESKLNQIIQITQPSTQVQSLTDYEFGSIADRLGYVKMADVSSYIQSLNLGNAQTIVQGLTDSEFNAIGTRLDFAKLSQVLLPGNLDTELARLQIPDFGWVNQRINQVIGEHVAQLHGASNQMQSAQQLSQPDISILRDIFTLYSDMIAASQAVVYPGESGVVIPNTGIQSQFSGVQFATSPPQSLVSKIQTAIKFADVLPAAGANNLKGLPAFMQSTGASLQNLSQRISSIERLPGLDPGSFTPDQKNNIVGSAPVFSNLYNTVMNHDSLLSGGGGSALQGFKQNPNLFSKLQALAQYTPADYLAQAVNPANVDFSSSIKSIVTADYIEGIIPELKDFNRSVSGIVTPDFIGMRLPSEIAALPLDIDTIKNRLAELESIKLPVDSPIAALTKVRNQMSLMSSGLDSVTLPTAISLKNANIQSMKDKIDSIDSSINLSLTKIEAVTAVSIPGIGALIAADKVIDALKSLSDTIKEIKSAMNSIRSVIEPINDNVERTISVSNEMISDIGSVKDKLSSGFSVIGNMPI